MKAKNILILILGTLILPIYLTSCGVDRWKEYAGQTQTDRWIDDTMPMEKLTVVHLLPPAKKASTLKR